MRPGCYWLSGARSLRAQCELGDSGWHAFARQLAPTPQEVLLLSQPFAPLLPGLHGG